MEDLLMTRFNHELHLQRENTTTPPTPEKIILFTDKTFMIFHQQHFLLSTLPRTDELGFEFGIKSTISPGLRSSISPVSLSPENRVTIETLAENVGQVLLGKYFLCRTLTPPHKMTSIMTIVDDPEGKLGVRIALYNYTNAREDFERILPIGMILAIKNPWFKPTGDGGLAVRCDNPGDVEIISPILFKALFPNLKWRGEIPIEYRSRAIRAPEGDESEQKLKLVEDLKNLGNKHFVEHSFIDSIRFYTQALDIFPNNIGLLVNRGASYLNIGCYRRALEDLKGVLEEDPFHVKGIYRFVRSLWGLRKYAEAVELLNLKFNQKASLVQEKELMKLKTRAEGILLESKTGKFDEFDIALKREKVEFFNIAEYNEPVEVRLLPGKGRCLFAKEDITAGQLIITEKAFALAMFQKNTVNSSVAVSLNLETNSMHVQGHDELVGLIAQKLRMEPELGPEFYKLYAGPELGSLSDEDEHLTKVDMKRIDKIVTYNAFSSLRVEDCHSPMTSLEKYESNKVGSGIWILSSYFNHSCLDANCTWNFFGDVMFIRSVKSIRKGQELLISYMDPISSYDKRCNVFRSHSFTCGCLLCKLDSEETDTTRRARNEIFEVLQIETARISRGNQPNFTLIRDNLSQLTSLYQKCPLLNHHLTGKTIDALCHSLFAHGNAQLSAEILEKGYPILKNINSLTISACSVSLNILSCYVVQRKTKKVKEWMEKLKANLILAYGSIEMIRVYGPLTLQTIERFGYRFFD